MAKRRVNKLIDDLFEEVASANECTGLSVDDGRQLFNEMIEATKPYLKDFYNLSELKI